jgi:hypothetical protein
MPDLADLSATAGVCGAPTIPRRAGSLVATKDVPAQGPATRRDTKANERTRQRTPQCRSELCAVTRRPSVGPNVPPPGLVGVLAEQSWDAWISKHHRTVRDYEKLPASHEAMILWAVIALMTRRLAHPTHLSDTH